ncbi:hypothetical protein EJB05_03552, partial [Eragrostis curvula]
MSRLRRFVNLVTLERKRDMYSLRRIDLWQHDFFYPATTPPPPPKAQRKLPLAADPKEMEQFETPPSCFNFQPKPCPEALDYTWKMHNFGVSENKIICVDNFGVSFLYNTDEPCVTTMPALHSPKRHPVSLSVFDPEDDDDGGGTGSLYVIEAVPRPRRREDHQGQFEAFDYGMSVSRVEKSWRRHSLPPPPFVLEPGYEHRSAGVISSYAVLGGGSHLCVSAAGFGTYCFDTARREWGRAGDWMLPIAGKAEYVPEIGLWFGPSQKENNYLPCVCDLSSALDGDEPELRCKWDNDCFPAEWIPAIMSHMVNLGAGRFFTVGYNETVVPNAYHWGEPPRHKCFSVLGGLELKPGRTCSDDEPQKEMHQR